MAFEGPGAGPRAQDDDLGLRWLNDFGVEWWKAAAVLHMAATALSRQESPYRRLVSNASVLVEQMADMIDFICTNQPSFTQPA